jgi:NAD-reducing hydrogenase large subunit
LPEAFRVIRQTLAYYKRQMDGHQEESRVFGNFPSLFMGMVTPDGGLEHYDGKLRFVDSGGGIVADQIDPADYREHIGEAVESWSYLKTPYYKPLGYPGGMYRVGPLARLNVASHCGTHEADRELAEFRQLGRGAVLSSFHYHYARLIEILFCLEKIEEILQDPEVVSPEVLAVARRSRYEGVGCSEAPRGTLFHHYKVGPGGLLTWVNLLIATGQNNLAMNETVLQIAKHFVNGNKLTEGLLNRVEAGIRAYDPCLSCSTHAAGQMPLSIRLVGRDGQVVDEVGRP